MVIVKILVFLLILSVIIVVHEFGHFFFAKRAGVLCHEFSLGMGPVLYKKKKGETTFSIRAIPIGGFVSMAGEAVTEDTIKVGDEIGLNFEYNEDGNKIVSELVLSEKKNSEVRGKVVRRELYGKHGEALEIDIEDENGNVSTYPIKNDAFYIFDNGTLQIAPYNRSFESKTLLQRFLSIAAGPVMNFVLAIFIYIICFLITGTPNYNSTTINKVSSNYPAYGILQKGDQILSVEGESVSSWTSFSNKMDELATEGTIEVSLLVQRKGISNPVECTIYNYVVINSIGLSNIQIDEDYYIQDISSIQGAQVGKVGLRYKNDVKSKETQITNGDIITAMNIVNHGTKYDESNWITIESWTDIVKALYAVDVADVYFKYLDVSENNTLTSTYNESHSQVVETYGNEVLDNQRIEKVSIYLGVEPVFHHNFFSSLGAAFKQFWSDFTLIFRTLKLLVHPTGVRQIGVSNLSGVVGIYSMIGTYLSAGIISLLLFMCMLSVNIGVMNLLPIPALDGGRIVFLAVEGIRRKPLNRKIEAMINNVMFIILMLFMLYVTFNDIMRLFH